MELSAITYLVKNYDEAIEYFRDKLAFKLLEDTRLTNSKRWVLVSPAGSQTKILLAKAVGIEQVKAIGNQGGGRVFLFLSTSHFEDSYLKFKANGVEFLEEPRNEPYGKVVVFRDLYGNKWDLIESSKEA
ncbi:MAG: VOC family protein [Bacteroidota bacterium]